MSIQKITKHYSKNKTSKNKPNEHNNIPRQVSMGKVECMQSLPLPHRGREVVPESAQVQQIKVFTKKVIRR